jgi:DNA-binding transcriptional ArsR family regulator
MSYLPHPRVEDVELPAVLRAMSDSTRLALLAEITRRPGKPCGTFETEMAKSTLSAHFKTLRSAGLIHQSVGPGNSRLNWPRTEELDTRFPRLVATVLEAYASLEA